MKPPKLVAEQIVGQGGRGQLRSLTYQFDTGETQAYDLFDVRKTMQGSAGVVPIDDVDNVYLVREFLPALGTFGLSIPRGGIEPGESAEAAAMRELREEAGLVCSKLTLLWHGTVLPNASSWQVTLYCGHGATPTEQFGGDEVGGVTTVKLPLAEACAMVMRGEITGALTGFALLLAQQKVAVK